ncbi:diacylglycerol/lipid kinase family protein [Aurantiacibacter poecillastricola]|uniref:diacylglycerol/lipid kinase family protein n=1 Tax=Aurantiacibacter poecillastricola TaxID=3064385 RepID=UPI0027402A0A|nr:diacylglycerol kinase family protein [Aurantiacibacter sp. 219JJ12-13]MDP5260529.1 diacylglycerol kinase family protein [Aurantiacibacter sp. 219JJ12-13]
MEQARALWFIHNDLSGSNDREALEDVVDHCSACNLRIAYRSSFPSDDLPTPAILDAGSIDLVIVFAGDGTVNATLEALAGWGGEVLILPGGTMNLLYHRLFGDTEWQDVVRKTGRGELVTRRPGVISTALGTAYAGLLAGPGTKWNDVREAMRKSDVLSMATETREAFVSTVRDEPLACIEPPLGRREGYPLLLLEPHDDGFDVYAYHAESTSEFVDQLLALAQRDFRTGPHDHIGREEKVTLAGVNRHGFGVLLDGEPGETEGPAEFALDTCKVDLLALNPSPNGENDA